MRSSSSSRRSMQDPPRLSFAPSATASRQPGAAAALTSPSWPACWLNGAASCRSRRVANVFPHTPFRKTRCARSGARRPTRNGDAGHRRSSGVSTISTSTRLAQSAAPRSPGGEKAFWLAIAARQIARASSTCTSSKPQRGPVPGPPFGVCGRSPERARGVFRKRVGGKRSPPASSGTGGPVRPSRRRGPVCQRRRRAGRPDAVANRREGSPRDPASTGVKMTISASTSAALSTISMVCRYSRCARRRHHVHRVADARGGRQSAPAGHACRSRNRRASGPPPRTRRRPGCPVRRRW